MNWTVGPHPSSVYWRRRLLLLVPLLVILLVLASCLITRGSSGDQAQIAGVPKTSAASPAGGASPSDPGESGVGSAGVSPSQESPDSATAAPQPQPQPPAGGSTAAAASCPDTALTLTAVPSDGAVRIGEFAAMRLVVKNSSSAACRRDVGSKEQELKILSGTTQVWSSDDCSSRTNAATAQVDRKLVPGETLNYFIKWGGTTSSKNCVTGAPVKPGKYQLVARLGTLQSKPAPFTVSP